MSLKVWLPFDGNLNNKGISDTLVENAGTVSFNTSGKIGQCAEFNRTETSYLCLPALLNATDEFSISFWVKHTTVNYNLCYYSLRVAADAKGIAVFYLTGSGIRFDDGASLTYHGTIETNKWYHVVCCRDSTKKYIYLNGELVLSGNKTNTDASKVNANYTLIGGSQGNIAGTPAQSANLLGGYLNDYRIYNHCLSAAEVHLISLGLICHYKLDDKEPEEAASTFDGNFLNTTWSFNDTIDVTTDFKLACFENEDYNMFLETPSGILADYAELSYDELLINYNSVYFVNTWIEPEYKTLTFIKEPDYFGTLTKAEFITWMQANATLLEAVSYSPPTIIIDSSGYGHHGTPIHSPTISTNIRKHYSSSLQFNGTNQCINCGRGGMVKDAITVNVWGYMETWNETQRLISCTLGGGWCIENNNGYVNFAMGTGTSGNTYKSVKSNIAWTSLSSGWHMFTGTYDGFATKVYVDGVLVGTNNAYNTYTPIFYHTSNNIYIGAEATATSYSSPYFNGIISDVRIYCTALSANDILTLYKIGAKIDNLQNLYGHWFNELNFGLYKTSQALLTDNYSEIEEEVQIGTYTLAIEPSPTITTNPIKVTRKYTTYAPIFLNPNLLSNYYMSSATYKYYWARAGTPLNNTYWENDLIVTGDTIALCATETYININFYTQNGEFISSKSIIESAFRTSTGLGGMVGQSSKGAGKLSPPSNARYCQLYILHIGNVDVSSISIYLTSPDTINTITPSFTSKEGITSRMLTETTATKIKQTGDITSNQFVEF